MNTRTVCTALAATICVATTPLAAVANYELALTDNGTSVTVSAPAGALDSSSRLYLVWDTQDHGADVSEWPVANRTEYTGTITAAAANYTISKAGVPNGSMMRAVSTCDVRLIDGWVKLGDKEYVNTGVRDTEAYGLEIKCRPTSQSSGTYSSLMGGVRDKFTIGMSYRSYDKYYIRYADGTEVGNPAFTLPNITEAHVIRIFDQKLYIDGIETATPRAVPSGTVGRTSVPVVLGMTWTADHVSQEQYCQAEWHRATLLDASGEPLVDLFPAVRGDTGSEETLFYDAVSGKPFYKLGIGTEQLSSGTATNTLTAVVSHSSEALYNGMTAYWKGGGDAHNPSDPANWVCTNTAGVEVTGVAPDADTDVVISGAVGMDFPKNHTFQYRELRFENVAITNDCDWGGLSNDYIVSPASSGANCTYIDTGFKPNQNTRVVIDLEAGSLCEYWFGVWDVQHNNMSYAVCNDNGSIYVGYHGNYSVSPALPPGRHVIDFYKAGLIVDGKSLRGQANKTFQCANSIYLFAQNRKGGAYAYPSQTEFKLYSCKIYDNGALIRDFVPYRDGSSYCLYDKCDGKVYHYQTRGSGAAVTQGTMFNGARGVDLKGHVLQLGDLTAMVSVTDSVGGGELHAEVAGDGGMTDADTTLSGKLKLVKTGTGRLVMSKAHQLYSGGTLVSAGRLVLGTVGTDYPIGADLSELRVSSGAVYDLNGKYHSCHNKIYLDGGTLENTVAMGSQTTDSIGLIALTANSTFNFLENTVLRCTWNPNPAFINMGGHELTINVANDKYLDMQSCTFTNGSVTVNGGKFRIDGQADVIGSTADFDIKSQWIELYHAISMRDFTCDVTTDGDYGDLSYAVSVCGTFRPLSQNFPPVVMQNGSTLDLSQDVVGNETWSVRSALPQEKVVSFAADATTINVKLDGRRGLGGKKIVSWSSTPDAKFVIATEGLGGSLVKKDDGLYYSSGLMLIVR